MTVLPDSYGNTIDVLSNDTDPDGDSLTIDWVDYASNGYAWVEEGYDGDPDTIAYEPYSGFIGTDSFMYTISDSSGLTDTATVTVSVSSNTIPAAAGDTYEAVSKQPLTVAAVTGVLANDSDADGDPLTALLVSGTSSGALTLNTDGSLSYTSNAAFVGTDSFTYRANDGTDDSNIATVTLTVIGNTPPMAANDSYEGLTGETFSIDVATGVLANDSDENGNPTTAVLVSGPTDGTLTLNADGSFTYTPDTDFVGSDSFTYKANDGFDDGGVATVTLNVVANSAPTLTNDEFEAYSGEATTLDVLLNDSDSNDHDLTIVAVDSAYFGTVTVIDGEAGTPDSVLYASESDYFGLDCFSYTVADALGATTTATATVTVWKRPEPVLEGLSLYMDTEIPYDLETRDAQLTGTIISTRPTENLRVEFDFDGDGTADATTDVDGTDDCFLYDVANDVAYGDVSLFVRAVEVDDTGDVRNPGFWQGFSFIYVEEHEIVETPEGDPNAATFDGLQVELPTPELVRVSGQVTNTNGGVEPTIEFDFEGDGVPDTTTTVADESFMAEFWTELGYGEVGIAVRTVDVDETTSETLCGVWTVVEFTREAPFNAPPEVTLLTLANDTDDTGDGITSDATLTGTVGNSDGTIGSLVLEIDVDTDDVADFTTPLDESSTGTFSVDIGGLLSEDGEVTVRCRTREWDGNTFSHVYGDWVELTFEYTAHAAARPQLQGIQLVNDTDTPDDGITTDAAISGNVVGNLDSFVLAAVQYDLNGDQLVDGSISEIDADTGSFIVDLNKHGLEAGTITLGLRASIWSIGLAAPIVGEWEEMTFTYEMPLEATPQILDLALLEDTDVPDDGITSDPRVVGHVAFTEEAGARLRVEYDWTGNELADGAVFVKASENAEFTVDLRDANLPDGPLTLRVRAGAWAPDQIAYRFGDWGDLTFTHQPEIEDFTMPAVTNLALLYDHDGDGVTSRLAVTGVVTAGDANVVLLPVQYDVNEDGLPEGTEYTDILGSGEFLLDLSSHITGDGDKTVQVRAGDWDPNTGELTYGAWSTMTFVCEAADESDEDLELVPENEPVPFTDEELEHATFFAPAFGPGISPVDADAESTPTFLTSPLGTGASPSMSRCSLPLVMLPSMIQPLATRPKSPTTATAVL